MEENLSVDNWVRSYRHKNQEPDDHDEALSLLRDLATNDVHDDDESPPSDHFNQEHEQHFDFSIRNLPKNKTCNADEIFFQGQIRPVTLLPSSSFGFVTRTISCSKSEPVSIGSSRSSSTRSHNSATSGSSSGGSSGSLCGPEFTGYKRATQKNQTRNQFHLHPSPTPQIRTRSFHHYNSKSSSSSSLYLSKWGYFQLGPVKPQEIGLADLKNRSQRNQRSGSKSIKYDQNQKNINTLLFGGCKCTSNVVETAVVSSSLMIKREKILNVKKEQHLKT